MLAGIEGVAAGGVMVNRFPSLPSNYEGRLEALRFGDFLMIGKKMEWCTDKTPADECRRGFQVMRLLSGVFAVEGVEEVYEFFAIFLGRRPGKDFVGAFH